MHPLSWNNNEIFFEFIFYYKKSPNNNGRKRDKRSDLIPIQNAHNYSCKMPTTGGGAEGKYEQDAGRLAQNDPQETYNEKDC